MHNETRNVLHNTQKQRHLWNTPLMWQGLYRPHGKVPDPAAEGVCVFASHIHPPKNFQVHCGRYGWKHSRSDTSIFGRGIERVEREVIEALLIMQKVEEAFVSSPLLSFSRHELEYLSVPCRHYRSPTMHVLQCIFHVELGAFFMR